MGKFLRMKTHMASSSASGGKRQESRNSDLEGGQWPERFLKWWLVFLLKMWVLSGIGKGGKSLCSREYEINKIY